MKDPSFVGDGFIWESGFAELLSSLFLRVSPRLITPPTEYSACTEFARVYTFLSRVLSNLDSSEFANKLKLPHNLIDSFRAARSGLVTADSGQWIMLTASLKAMTSQNPDYSPICSHISMLIDRLKSGSLFLLVPFCVRIHPSTPPEWSVIIITNFSSLKIKNPADNTAPNYSLTIINVAGSGRGGEFHQTKLGPDGPLQDAALTVSNISFERLTQPAFWFYLFRLGAHPDKDNFSIIYKTLIYYLTDRPYYSHWTEVVKRHAKKSGVQSTNLESVWIPLPNEYHPGTPMTSALACLEYMIKTYYSLKEQPPVTRTFDDYLHTQWIVLILLLCEVKSDIIKSSCISFATKRLSQMLNASSRLIASMALMSMNDKSFEFVDQLTRVSLKLSNDIFLLSEGEKFFPLPDAAASHDTNGSTDAYILWNFHGFLCGKLVDVGDKSRHALTLPVNLASIGGTRASNLNEFSSILHKTSQICLLLFNQRSTIPHAPMWAFYLIRYVMLELIPDDVTTNNINNLKESIAHLHLLARYFLIACGGISHNKHMLADRSTVLAAFLCTAHEMLSKLSPIMLQNDQETSEESNDSDQDSFEASNDTFANDTGAINVDSLNNNSLSFGHFYSGVARGSIGKFNIDIPGFAQTTSEYIFSDPVCTIYRSRVCRWLSRCKRDRLIFDWGRDSDGLKMGLWDEELVSQLALAFGFQGDYAEYFVGGNEQFSMFFPEFLQLRDLALFAKYFCCADSPNSLLYNVPVGSYTLKDVTPQWQAHGKTSKHNRDVAPPPSNKDVSVDELGEFNDACRIIRQSDEVAFLSVKMFGTHLKIPSEAHNSHWFKSLKWWYGENKMPTSNAHPVFFMLNSAMSNSQEEVDTYKISKLVADNEQDILYLSQIPHIPDNMSLRDVELFMQYLTAPYVRIPLLLGFFNSETKVSLLGNFAIQQSLWSALLEPGIDVQDCEVLNECSQEVQRHDKVKFSVPVENRSVLGTKYGLLANELEWSPESVLVPLIGIFERVLEAARASSLLSTNTSLPFCIRLVSCVLRYCTTLRCDSSYVKRLESLLLDASDILWKRFMKCINKMKIPEACVSIAHIALSASCRLESKDAINEIGICILFLFNHFKFGDADACFSNLGIPESELFLLLQKVRSKLVLYWAGQIPITSGGFEDHDYNILPEEICKKLIFAMQVVTLDFNKNKNSKIDSWISNGSRLYMNLSQARADFGPLGTVHRKKKIWSKISRKLKGRREVIKTLPGQFYYDYLCESNKLSSIQIDLDFMTLLVGDSKIRLVPEWVNKFESFTSNFGLISHKNPMQCSLLSITQNRTWLRLLGRGVNHDLIVYRKGPKSEPQGAVKGLPPRLQSALSFLFQVTSCRQGEDSSFIVYGKIKEQQLQEVNLFDYSDKFSPPSLASRAARVYNNIVNLTSTATTRAIQVANLLWENPKGATSRGVKKMKRKALAQIVNSSKFKFPLFIHSDSESDTESTADPGSAAPSTAGSTTGVKTLPDDEVIAEICRDDNVRVWQVIEWGGRMCQVLIFEHWNREDPGKSISVGKLYFDVETGNRWLVMPLVTLTPDGDSVVLIKDNKWQYIDPFFLRGFLPHYFIEEYQFWTPFQGEEAEDPVDSDIFLIGFHREDPTGERIPSVKVTKEAGGMKISTFKIIRNESVQVDLIDIERYAKGRFKHSWAAEALMNIESLSHLLAWGTSSSQVVLFELPRLSLTFTLEDGRFYCQEHAGLYLSKTFSPLCTCLSSGKVAGHESELRSSPSRAKGDDKDYLKKLRGDELTSYPYIGCIMCGGLARGLIEGLPKTLILENEDNCIKILFSSIAKPLLIWNSNPRIDSENASNHVSRLFKPLLIWDYHDPEYLASTTGSRYFIFNLHASRAFLTSPDHQADLWHLLVRLIAGHFSMACRIIPTLSIDHSDPATVAWLNILLQFNTLNTPHPDFVKIELLFEHLGLRQTTAYSAERYFAIKSFMDADCLLNTQEELVLSNRFSSSSSILPFKAKLEEKPYSAKPPPLNLSTMSNCPSMPQFSLRSSHHLDVSYLSASKVKKYEDAPRGQESLAFYDKMLQRGVSVSDMLVLYQLMTKQFPASMGFHENECFFWGVILFYHLIFADSSIIGFKEGAFLFNLLGLLSSNPTMAFSGLPVVPQVKKKGFGGLISFRNHSPLVKFISELKEKTSISSECSGDMPDWTGCKWADFAHDSLKDLYSTISIQPKTKVSKHIESWGDDLEEWVIDSVGQKSLDTFINTSVLYPLETLAKDSTIRRIRNPPLKGYNKALQALENYSNISTDAFASEDLSQTIVELIGFEESSINKLFLNNNVLGECVMKLQHIKNELLKALRDDTALQALIFKQITMMVSGTQMTISTQLAHCSKSKKSLRFDELVEITIERNRRELLQELEVKDGKAAEQILQLVALVMLLVNRRALILKAMSQLRQMLNYLRLAATDQSHVLSLLAAARTLASTISTKRHYIKLLKKGCIVDARFLSFEFFHNFILRENQVQLVRKLVSKVRSGESLCHQLMMGQGKTSVISPLLSMFLADGKRLVVHVSPQPLVEFTRNILQQRYSSLTNKSVFTFTFTRYDQPTEEMVNMFIRSRLSGSIVLTTPLSIKSLFLKSIEACGSPESKNCISILRLFSESVLIMDEVDLIVDPLKSELHWPLGDKVPLPDARHNVSAKIPFRWYLPWHLIEGFLYASGSFGSLKFPAVSNVAFKCFRGSQILTKLKLAIARGVKEFALCVSPHIAILNHSYYHTELVPLLNEWANLALSSYGLPLGGVDCEDSSSPRALVERWLRVYFPHIFSKINRVAYGILSTFQLDSYTRRSISRCFLAVPYVGKDTPSKNSEFSHPDILLGLTVLAYRFQGLRVIDFFSVMQSLLDEFESQTGPPKTRYAYFRFNQWVANAESDKNSKLPFSGLDLFNINEKDHVELAYELLRYSPLVIRYYLINVIFPLTMKHAFKQLTATAQELASSILFRTRLGFSGTPSNLLPADMGRCEFAKNSNAHMLRVLTDPSVVVDATYLSKNWSPRSILKYVATSDVKPLALIDSGALITGIDNLQVALILLDLGLEHVEAVAYIEDETDRQMVVYRNRSIRLLSLCGLPSDKRFTFYDQVHSTGQDIKQAPLACAFVTIGKDMTFRDYSQGAWRMRSLDEGQTIRLLLPPEIRNLVEPSQQNVIEHEERLVCISVWLIRRLSNMEHKLNKMLKGQNAINILRKQAFSQYLSYAISQRISGGTDQLADVLSVFIENRNLNVGANFESLKNKNLSFIESHRSLLNAKQLDRIYNILGVTKSRVECNDFFTSTLDEGESDQGEDECYLEAEEEQEQEQEQEREEEKEQEREKEQESVQNLPPPIKFTKPSESVFHWRLETFEQLNAKDLDLPHVLSGMGFIRLSEFYLYKKDSSKPQVLSFPSFVFVSPNFYNTAWNTTNRRLSNVSVVLEIAPTENIASNRREIYHGLDFLVEQALKVLSQKNPTAQSVKQAIDIVDPGTQVPNTLLGGGQDGVMGLGSLCEVVRYSEDGGLFKEGGIEYCGEGERDVVGGRGRFCVENRAFIVVTLNEAESVRAWLHQRKGQLPVHISFCQYKAGFEPFDGSVGFPHLSRDSYHRRFCYASLKFFNADIDMDGNQVRILSRAFNRYKSFEKTNYFNMLRMARKIFVETDLRAYPIGQLFVDFDELDFVILKSTVLKIKKQFKITPRSLYPLFNLWDTKKQGYLQHSDIIAVLAHITPPIQPSHFKILLSAMDMGNSGKVTVQDLYRVFFDAKVGELERESSIWDEHHDYRDGEVLGLSYNLKLVKHTKFKLVWRGIIESKTYSFWEPMSMFSTNRVKFSLGHYLVQGDQFEKNCPLPETIITDKNKMLPNPVRFDRIAGFGDLNIYLPIPPEGFVAIGIAVTTDGSEPLEDDVTCLPLEYVKEADVVESASDSITLGDVLFYTHTQTQVLATEIITEQFKTAAGEFQKKAQEFQNKAKSVKNDGSSNDAITHFKTKVAEKFQATGQEFNTLATELYKVYSKYRSAELLARSAEFKVAAYTFMAKAESIDTTSKFKAAVAALADSASKYQDTANILSQLANDKAQGFKRAVGEFHTEIEQFREKAKQVTDEEVKQIKDGFKDALENANSRTCATVTGQVKPFKNAIDQASTGFQQKATDFNSQVTSDLGGLNNLSTQNEQAQAAINKFISANAFKDHSTANEQLVKKFKDAASALRYIIVPLYIATIRNDE